MGFRPLSGSFFLSDSEMKISKKLSNVSVPCRGLSFYLILFPLCDNLPHVSVPCRGLSFYLNMLAYFQGLPCRVSVPCRGLSFYLKDNWRYKMFRECFRPLSGSFFLSWIPLFLLYGFFRFPSPVGVFLFILMKKLVKLVVLLVSVPCRGLSFYL